MGDIALSLAGEREQPLVGRFTSDERLARVVARGSRSAFALLYERHYQALYRYCRSILREDEDARDALQNTMMRAFAALSARERDLAVRPWLFRIAHNEAITILRKRRPTERATQEEEPAPQDVEQLAGQRAELATLVADLQTLAERQRSALVMRELNGLSIEEIAQALSTSPGAAKQALFEARNALHEMAQGREMNCETVRRSISERDGRVLRGRKLRAHVRSCAGCREFSQAIPARASDLNALAPPLPAVAAASVLARLLGLGGGGTTGGAGAGAALGGGAASSASFGGHAIGSLALKALAGTVALTAATAGTVHLVSSSTHHKHTPASHAGARASSVHSTRISPATGVRSAQTRALTLNVAAGARAQKTPLLGAVKLLPAGSHGVPGLGVPAGAGPNRAAPAGSSHAHSPGAHPAPNNASGHSHRPQASHSHTEHGGHAGAPRTSPSTSQTGQRKQTEKKAEPKPARNNAANHREAAQTPTAPATVTLTTQTTHGRT
jgi:RNA polymerase sigma factor (sigma-70 family)